jgi:hypothetical protein
MRTACVSPGASTGLAGADARVGVCTRPALSVDALSASAGVAAGAWATPLSCASCASCGSCGLAGPADASGAGAELEAGGLGPRGSVAAASVEQQLPMAAASQSANGQ